jgi:SAM-dependent methyltransferase
MADPIFENSRLVEIYDELDGKRSDLDHYIAIAKELKAQKILDVGSGTGCFATLAIEHGFQVIGVEPALASLKWAQKKPNAERVRWIHGYTSSLPRLEVDLAVMTGNVAQVFTSDESWEENLIAIRNVLRPDGHLVFEVRDPAQKAWLEWNREKTYRRVKIPNIGYVEEWNEVIDVSGQLVSFRWTYVFESDGAVIKSDSILRFRERAEIEASLVKCGYRIVDVRGAPDRPNKEFVFIASPA